MELPLTRRDDAIGVQLAFGYGAIGGFARGYYAMGGNVEGVYQIGGGRQDQEAVDFFREHAPYVLQWWS